MHYGEGGFTWYLNPTEPAALLQHLDPAANVTRSSLPSPASSALTRRGMAQTAARLGPWRGRVGIDQQNVSSPRALNRWTPPESIFSFLKQCWGEKHISYRFSVILGFTLFIEPHPMSCCSEYITIYDDTKITRLLQIPDKVSGWAAKGAAITH